MQFIYITGEFYRRINFNPFQGGGKYQSLKNGVLD
jgi:hypothetical protein